MELYTTASLNVFLISLQQSMRWKPAVHYQISSCFCKHGGLLAYPPPFNWQSEWSPLERCLFSIQQLWCCCPHASVNMSKKGQGWERKTQDIFMGTCLMIKVASSSAECVLFLTCLCIRSQSFSRGSETYFLSSCWNTRLLDDSERLISRRKASVSMWQYWTKLSFNSCN